MYDNYAPYSGSTQPLAHKQHASHKNIVTHRVTWQGKTPFNLFRGKAKTECRAIMKNWEPII